MDSKIILIKFPDGKFHTASVSRFVSVPYAGKEINTIWYIDLTEIEYEDDDTTGSFSIIRDNNDGTYTNLNCGLHENYTKIYDELKKEILNNNYTSKDINTLPYSIDTVEDYDFFNNNTPSKEVQSSPLSDNIVSIKREINSRIGAFIEPTAKDNYEIEEDKLCNHLNQISNKITQDEWVEIEDDILSYLAMKNIAMDNGYIKIGDATNALQEIENIALSGLNDNSVKEEPVLNEEKESISFPTENNSFIYDEPEKEPSIIYEEAPLEDILPTLKEEQPTIEDIDLIVEDNSEEIEKPLEDIDLIVEETPKEANNYNYVKTIYVLWNELLSNLANFVYLEYDSFSKMANYYNYSYTNITDNYRHINRELLKLIKGEELTIKNKSVITL